MIGYVEKALCRKIARVFEYAASKGHNPSTFANTWLNSGVANRIYNCDFNDVAQSPIYLYNSLKMETNITDLDDNEYYKDLMFWLGYMLTYLEFFEDNIPAVVAQKYDVLRYAGSYDVLHTLSAKNAAEECISDYKTT